MEGKCVQNLFPLRSKARTFEKRLVTFLEKFCSVGLAVNKSVSATLAPSWLGLPLITWCHHQLFHVHSSFLVSGEKFSNLLNLTNHTCHTAAVYGKFEECFSRHIFQLHSTSLFMRIPQKSVEDCLKFNCRNNPINLIIRYI